MYYSPKLFKLNSLRRRIRKEKQNRAENHSSLGSGRQYGQQQQKQQQQQPISPLPRSLARQKLQPLMFKLTIGHISQSHY